MKTDEIRELYLSFFEKKNHSRIPSDSLVPQNDPTLLFTGAGMNQFKDYFLGLKKDMNRAVSSQKCLRTGDLEEVGRTPYHHSFFEMLGNFSFGDYFKKEAIQWAWELLTDVLKISKERLRISVHQNDEEAYLIWKNEIGIRPDWIYKLGDKGNFWPSNAPKDGPNGPCGPCSEIYFDQGEDPNNIHDCDIECDCRRFAEIWNLVFTQYDRQDGGVLKPLAQKNIDTGMGLERLACVLQGKKTNYEIDTLQKINHAVIRELGIQLNDKNTKRVYAITDHIRAVVFAITDGVIPSNEGRGYVIRKLIRRALWHGYEASQAQLNQPFLYRITGDVADVMGNAYPEIRQALSSVSSVLKSEEERFLNTLERGLDRLTDYIDKLLSDKRSRNVLAGEFVFELYDTYGFPDELTRKIAEEKGLEIDQQEFLRLMEAQRNRAKESSQISTEIFVTSKLEKETTGLAPTKFLGYEKDSAETQVLYADVNDGKGVVVLDSTPFYGESGGQVGDQGTLGNSQFSAQVLDTQKRGQLIIHFIRIDKGSVTIGDKVTASIDGIRRMNAARNHTATHLLHASLRNFLGNQVRQLGSLVSPEKLRFDYSYPAALTSEQLKDLEDSVNAVIWNNIRVVKDEKPLAEAKNEGAIAFFGEKYSDKVRVITVPGFSKELCGGTHCDQTGQIGFFVIVSDSSIASGTRRIEAVTGPGAFEYLRSSTNQIRSLSEILKSSPTDLVSRVGKLQDQVKKLEKEKKKGFQNTPLSHKQIIAAANDVPGKSFKFASFFEKGLEIDQLRTLSDGLRSEGSNLVYLLVSEHDEKLSCLLGLSPDLKDSNFDLRNPWKQIAPLLGVSGGGRKDFIQAGGKNTGALSSHWESVVNKTISALSQE